jgi:hypothetical protein
MDIFAFGGVEGIITIMDYSTKRFWAKIQAHKAEIMMLKFYDEQK